MNATGRISDAALARLLHDVEREAARRDTTHPAEYVIAGMALIVTALLCVGAL